MVSRQRRHGELTRYCGCQQASSGTSPRACRRPADTNGRSASAPAQESRGRDVPCRTTSTGAVVGPPARAYASRMPSGSASEARVSSARASCTGSQARPSTSGAHGSNRCRTARVRVPRVVARLLEQRRAGRPGRPVGHDLGAAGGEPVPDLAEGQAEDDGEPGFFSGFPDGGAGQRLPGLDLALRPRPVVVAGAVDEQDLEAVASVAPAEHARGALDGHSGVTGCGSLSGAVASR